MTDAPSPRCSPTPQIAGTETEQQFEDRLMKQDATDNLRLLDYIAHKIGLPINEEMSRENFSAWFSSRPQIAGGVRERAESSIKCLRAPDPALKAVPNTVRQALAEVIEQLLAALSPQAQAGGVAQAAPDRIAELQYEAGMYQSLYEVAKGRLEYMESKYGKIDWDAYPVSSTDREGK